MIVGNIELIKMQPTLAGSAAPSPVHCRTTAALRLSYERP